VRTHFLLLIGKRLLESNSRNMVSLPSYYSNSSCTKLGVRDTGHIIFTTVIQGTDLVINRSVNGRLYENLGQLRALWYTSADPRFKDPQ
jgi:hypothetical protein